MLYTGKAAPKVIVTDLDGTLLDHHTYAWSDAAQALSKAQSLGIPIVPCTSKTFAETRPLADSIGLQNCPIICENGSGIQFSNGQQLDIARTYDELIERLNIIRGKKHYQYQGFADLSVSDVESLTGLPPEKAALAYRRTYSEPIVWCDTKAALANFIQDASEQGIAIVRGGRFYHALHQGVSKYNAVQHLLTELNTPNANWIALGDGDNDIPLLANADFSVVVNNPTKHFPVLDKPLGTCLYTSGFGPAGWNSAINYILENFYG